MNLEVDVMDGDRFTVMNGHVSQWRGSLWRYVRLNHVGEWESLGTIFTETPIDLSTFTRYCQGCGLTVKEVKPEPAVETIKPPEWAIIWPNGAVNLCKDLETARGQIRGTEPRVVRIDWSRP